MNYPVKRVLISVSDKTGLIEFAKFLVKNGSEIISTGGTRAALEAEGIPSTAIEKVTGNPEAFSGRMKTISFQIGSALLFDRERDQEEALKLGIRPIDLVVCNLYPFEKFMDKDLESLVENIDIGGPTMIRAAAKNYKSVGVVVSPEDYTSLIDEMKNNEGALTADTRATLMRKAYHHTADYDAMISTEMDRRFGEKSIRLSFNKGETLRYGENGHQNAVFYKERNKNNTLYDMKALHGKMLSFNNIVDINASIEGARSLKRSGCVIVKHATPCGFAEAENLRSALELAWEGDPVSAFGSIIAFNEIMDLETAQYFDLKNSDRSKRKFVEVIIAPAYSDDALEYLKSHKDLRVILMDPKQLVRPADIRYLGGSLLLQDQDEKLHNEITCVTKTYPELEMANNEFVEFGLKAVRQVKSNAIVIVRKTRQEKFKDSYQMLGMGAGQPNRLNSTRLAIDRARENLKLENCDDVETELRKCLLVSDAFFPFPDAIDEIAKAGIKTVVQPGGSMRDSLVVDRCNELGLSMLMTGIRHFKH